MPKFTEIASTGGGLKISWGAEHRDGQGNLISRQTMIEPPTPPTCLRPDCLLRYLKSAVLYALVANYHAKRVAYAESSRHKKILERYRTGVPSPQTILQAIHANLKLKCPICRKYNVDPLLFKGGKNDKGS